MDAYARPGKQAMPAWLLRALRLHASKHNNMLDYS